MSGLRRKICDGPYKERQDKGATEVARIRESGTAAEKRRIDRCENYDPARKSVLDRNDFGFGVGLAAFDIANTISTDIRFRTDATTPFDGLPPGETITTTDSRSFNTRFHNIYWTYHISDEFRFSLDLRNYERDTTNDATVDVNDTQVSLTGLWYPTWAW